MESFDNQQIRVGRERAVLAACLLPEDGLDPHDPLGELRQLADTAGAVVVDELMQKRDKPEPATFIGKGKVEQLAEMVRQEQAEVVIFENALQPSQIGNIEQGVGAKVIDRSELILDIFAARAKTHEARLQVELAQLEYTYPRLTAMWSHLERIAGGAPAGIGTRGPGEQQLEIDRRIVQRKKTQLKRQIADVQARKTRQVQQRNSDFFTVGLVGYTNAGKSTLFNALTTTRGRSGDAEVLSGKRPGGIGPGGGAYADDKLFATLSTRTRKWHLGGGQQVMLSDTVGFVRHLPHHLVASFKATLEEAVHSDLLLVVLDSADPLAQRCARTVVEVLDEIGADTQPRVYALNKTDQLTAPADLFTLQQAYPDALPISAKTGEGLDALTTRIADHARGRQEQLTLTAHAGDGKALSFLEAQAHVLDRHYEHDQVRMTVRIGQRPLDRLRSMGTSVNLPQPTTNGDGPGWGRKT